jgi:hypothetical protein
MNTTLSDIGLCHDCLYHSVVRNNRNIYFHLCKKSKSDPSFPKYPRLPVRECIGFLSTESAKKSEK